MDENFDKKLSKFTEAVIKDAAAERDEIIARLQEEKEEKLKTTQDEAIADAYTFIQENVSKIQAESQNKISKKVFEAKREVLKKRDEIENAVFKTVKDKITEFVNTDQYKNYIKSKLQSVDQNILSSNIKISINKDQTFLNEIIHSVFAEAVIEPDSTIKLGGFYIEDIDNSHILDFTFDSKFLKCQENFLYRAGLSAEF